MAVKGEYVAIALLFRVQPQIPRPPEAVLIIIKNSLKVLMEVLTKSHDPPSKPPKTELHPHLKSIVYSPRAYARKHPQIP